MASARFRHVAHLGLVLLAALGVSTLSACDSAGGSATRAPAAAGTPAAGKPVTVHSAPAAGDSGPAAGSTAGAKGDSSALPDGTHDGYLTKVDVANRTVVLDKVELLSGDAARKAYQKENPREVGGPPDDYFLVNNNKLLRTLPVADGVTVSVIDLAGHGVQPVPSSFAKLPAFLAVKDNSTLFKVTVKGGAVTALASIYLP